MFKHTPFMIALLSGAAVLALVAGVSSPGRAAEAAATGPSLIKVAVGEDDDNAGMEDAGSRSTSPAATKGAMAFVDGVGKRGIGILSAAATSEGQRKQSFKSLLNDSFDLTTIGRFALGRYWRVATPQQRSEYQRLFEKMIIDVYSDRFSSYSGQQLKTASAKMVSNTDAMVTTFILPKDGGEKVQVDWRVRNAGGKYKIVDVVVEGVSMSVTQRSDFASVIQRGGGDIAVLIDHLKNPRKG
jgi:phospholipid transport system substrate-binding protein